MTQTPTKTSVDPLDLTAVPAKPEIAHGTRRDEVHYEADPDQVVQIRHTFKPDGRLPPDEQTDSATPQSADPPVQDVKVVKPAPSVWEALPETDEDQT